MRIVKNNAMGGMTIILNGDDLLALMKGDLVSNTHELVVIYEKKEKEINTKQTLKEAR